MCTIKISSKEVIGHHNMKYKVGETHDKYFMGQKTKILDDEGIYASCALNCASQNNESSNNFHTRIMRQISYQTRLKISFVSG